MFNNVWLVQVLRTVPNVLKCYYSVVLDGFDDGKSANQLLCIDLEATQMVFKTILVISQLFTWWSLLFLMFLDSNTLDAQDILLFANFNWSALTYICTSYCFKFLQVQLCFQLLKRESNLHFKFCSTCINTHLLYILQAMILY